MLIWWTSKSCKTYNMLHWLEMAMTRIACQKLWENKELSSKKRLIVVTWWELTELWRHTDKVALPLHLVLISFSLIVKHRHLNWTMSIGQCRRPFVNKSFLLPWKRKCYSSIFRLLLYHISITIWNNDHTMTIEVCCVIFASLLIFVTSFSHLIIWQKDTPSSKTSTKRSQRWQILEYHSMDIGHASIGISWILYS